MDIEKLELWYLKNRRLLPFRSFCDPYRIWVSEIMLQQTQVDTVLPYYERFLKEYPTLQDLANTNEEKLHKMVEGLGYYRRFGNMLLAARQIVAEHQGNFPETYEEISSLPGIGKYTTGAILSIAFNQPYSALDGNVIRVLSRYEGISGDMKQEKNRKKLDQLNQTRVEQAHPEVYTQAMMELGALVCKPTHPNCEQCPLASNCYAFSHNAIEKFPELSKAKNKKTIRYVTFLLHQDGKIWVKKRLENLLKDMYLYPQIEVDDLESALDAMEGLGATIVLQKHHKMFKHVFSHQTWVMDVYEGDVTQGKLRGHQLVTQEELETLPMAVAHRKIKEAV